MGKGGRVFWQSCRRGESIDYDPRELKFLGGGAGSPDVGACNSSVGIWRVAASH